MAARRPEVRHTGSGIQRFSPHPHAGYEKSEADTHVEFLDDVLSDAGSTPAASKSPISFPINNLIWRLAGFPPPPPEYISKAINELQQGAQFDKK
jgi:hypothetical protein